MRVYDPAFLSALAGAVGGSTAAVWFLWVAARDMATDAPAPMGFWTGQENITVTAAPPGGGAGSARTYLGQCGLQVPPIQMDARLSDRPISVQLAQAADAVNELIRGRVIRFVQAELHVSVMAGGVLAAPPQLEYVGLVDAAPITTPEAGGVGRATLSLRSELMAQLTTPNPAKSSDAHQRRRQAGDRFSQYAGSIRARNVQWYRKG
jgi:hypothetical protein